MDKKFKYSIKSPSFKLTIITLTLLLLSTVLLTTAWLIIQNYHSAQNVGMSNFNAVGDVYFINNGSRVDVDTYREASGLIRVNLSDSSAPNYFGKLHLDVTYTGVSPAYIRVRVLEQWLNASTDELESMAIDTPYILGSAYTLTTGEDDESWYDNRLSDLCFYYAKEYGSPENSDALNTNSALAPETLPIITGVNSTFLNRSFAGINLYLSFTVEAVQPNRYKEFWKLDKLPWKNS